MEFRAVESVEKNGDFTTGRFCEYERLVNGSKQCGDGPFALSKGASPRLAGQSED